MKPAILISILFFELIILIGCDDAGKLKNKIASLPDTTTIFKSLPEKLKQVGFKIILKQPTQILSIHEKRF
jgi:hypothetical protein